GKPDNAYLIDLLRKIAAVFRVDLSETTQAVYWEILYDYPKSAIEQAAQRVIREWPEASKMPTPAFILERIEDAIRKNRDGDLLVRQDKPADWEPDAAAKIIAEVKAAALKHFPSTARE